MAKAHNSDVRGCALDAFLTGTLNLLSANLAAGLQTQRAVERHDAIVGA